MVMLSLLKYRDAKLSADCRNIGLWGNIRMQNIIGQSRSSGVEEPEPPYFLLFAPTWGIYFWYWNFYMDFKYRLAKVYAYKKMT